MTIHYNGYNASKGTTRVSLFWSDMHICDFRAEKPIESFEDLKEQAEKFKADREAFDEMNYDAAAKFRKANREYDCFIEREIDFEVLVFLYQGKTYRTRTRRHFPVVPKIRKNAEKVVSHQTERMLCLVSDATGEVFGEGDVVRTFDKMDHYNMI